MKLYEVINGSNWCKDKTAVLKDGTPTYSKDPNAAKRCFLAWIYYHYNLENDELKTFAKPILDHLNITFLHEIIHWNDDENTSIEDVIILCKDLDI